MFVNIRIPANNTEKTEKQITKDYFLTNEEWRLLKKELKKMPNRSSFNTLYPPTINATITTAQRNHDKIKELLA